MSLTFANTHNMVAYLNKSDASEGFNQVIDFLNGSYIQYALTVNPTIYVSCIKQFWNTVAVNQSNDVTRLQALVDRKKVVITEAAIRDVLRLDDANGVDCLPNEKIFAELARMGYEKPFPKLTFYKAFFSSQWKFLIHTILQSMSAKRTSRNEFSSAMASAVICLSTEEQVHGNDNDAAQRADTAVLGDDVQDQSIPSPTPPPPPPQQPQDIPSTSQEALDACAALTRRVEPLEHDKVAQDLEITMLKKRMKKLERANKVKVLKLRRLKKVGTSQRIKSSDVIDMEDASNQGRMIADLDRDEGIALMDDEGAKKKAEDAQEDEPEVQEAVELVTTAKLITKVVATVSKSVSAASATIAAVPAATITAAPVRVAAASSRRRKGVVEMDEEYARKLHEELNKDIDWDVTIDHVKQKAKEDSYVQKYQVMKKRPQTEAQARRNMIMYLKNVVGFRLDYFKGMSYDDIRPIFEAKFNLNIEFLLKSKEQIEEEENRAIKSIHETPAQKAAKRRKLNEESNVCKTRWTRSSLKESKDCSWSSKVERRYPLSRFTLDQMLNAVRLRVEEQSEMSLELIRFTRQQLQKGQHE
nr:hypothetical protein [Tanacetum cinerariifolium]